MNPTDESRTRERAQEVFAGLLEDTVSDKPDLLAILSPDVVAQVMDTAWRHQFDADRGAFSGEVRSIVRDAVEAWMLKD